MKRNVSHTLRVVKFGKQETLKELLNNLWNSNLMETYVIIGCQSACNNANTIYGVMRNGKACNTMCGCLYNTLLEKGWKGKTILM